MYLTIDLRLIFYKLRDKERKHSRLTVIIQCYRKQTDFNLTDCWENSNLRNNTICCSTDCCRKGAQWTDFNTTLIMQNQQRDQARLEAWMKTSYILLAEHHDYNVQTKLCVLGLLNTHFGKSCIPDSFLTLSPHLEALCKTMLNLVDSDYFSHTILSSTTFQTDTTPRSIFFRKRQMVWEGTGHLNSGNRLRMSLIFPSRHRIF